MARDPVLLLWSMVLAAGLGLLCRSAPGAARVVATSSSAFVLILSIGGLARAGRDGVVASGIPGVDVNGLSMPFELVTNRPLAAVAFIVAVVVAAVQVYAAWYLAGDDRYPVFAATVSLFAAAMLLVVHADDLVLVLIGWEVMGWCSYLLIGHWSRRGGPRTAAHKALLVTRVADVGFILGTAGLATGAGTTSIRRVVEVWTGTGECAQVGACVAPGAGLRNLVMVLLLLGILGKAAQLPFQDWLPDAMEGPTPASALIHAATMVAAGTLVLTHLFPVLATAPVARWVLAVATSATMLFAAFVAFGQSDLKRLLAWSTVSQVAIMLSAFTVATTDVGPGAGLFHMWAHAIFKALLFLALGWLAVIAGGTSARALRGVFHAAPTVLVWGMIFGLVSLAGVPLLVGGLSKEHVLATAYDDAVDPHGGPGLLVLCALLLTVVLTAAYSTRVYLVLTAPLTEAELPPEVGQPAATGSAPGHSLATGSAPGHPAGPGPAPVGHHGEAGASVRAVIGILSALSVFGGLVLLSDVFDVTEASLVWSGITLALIAVGAVGAILAHGDSDPAVRLLGDQMRLWDNGFGADAAYRALVAPIIRLARVVAHVDREAIDGYVVGSALAARLAGRAGDRLHRAARPVNAMALVVTGIVVLGAVGVFTWR